MASHFKLDNAGIIQYGGAKTVGWVSNLIIQNATTTNANDSIKITGDGGTALSATNPGWITLQSQTSGQMKTFEVTADVTINLTGALWVPDGSGDLSDAILRVLAINDNGTLKWGVAYLGGMKKLLPALTFATPSSITLPHHVLCNSAVVSNSNTALDVFWFRVNFDDTGGAAENLWTIQTGIDDLNFGSADGYWQPWNPVYGGFSGTPTFTASRVRWTQNGHLVNLMHEMNGSTSNATNFTLTGPVQSRSFVTGALANYSDNATLVRGQGYIDMPDNGTTINAYTSSGTWTNSSTKSVAFTFFYEARFAF